MEKNLRERRRCARINNGFLILREIVEDSRVKKLSKAKLLLYLKIYIDETEKIIKIIEIQNSLIKNFIEYRKDEYEIVKKYT